MLSFAGIQLPEQSGPVLERLGLLSLQDLFDFTRVTSPGSALATLGWPSQARSRQPRLGSLWWPQGASRFAIGFFLVTNNELAPIRTAVYSSPGVSAPQNFVINDGKRSLTTSLYMLPPRRLTQIAGNDDSWLMPLVDARYWWWDSASKISVTGGTTAWTDLYSSIAGGIGIALSVDAISGSYLTPPGDFGVGYDHLPVLLDAVARTLGQRIVRDFAGNVRAWNVTASQTQLATNFSTANNGLLAGGAMNVVSGSNIDLPSLVPSSVTVVFRRQGSTGTRPFDQKNYQVTLASLGLPEFAGVTGTAGSFLLRSRQTADWDASSVPDNDADLSAYATQAATDWYRYATSAMDATYSGVLNWTPEGLTDSLEFFHRDEMVYTRVQRQPWNEQMSFDFPTPQTVIAVLNSAVPDPATGLYDATIQYYDPDTQLWNAGENIWLRDANQF